MNLLIYEADNDLREGLGQFLSASKEFTIQGLFSNCETIVIYLEELKADVGNYIQVYTRDNKNF